MAHGNGRIYKDSNSGVSLLGDLREFFGLPYDGLYDLITEAIFRGLVNKWAKYKPIHYPGKIPLEDADFRGRPIDTNDNGLVYGLKVPAQISIIVPSAFHNTTWDYLGYPNAPGLSGTSLYRDLDFNGYYDDALPDIYGIIPSTSKFYVGTDDGGIVTANSVVNEGYRVNNPYGVPLSRYVVDGVTLNYDDFMGRLAKCYPAILIGNYLTGVGVYNSTTGNVDYETIVKYNGGWVVHSDSWCVDMRKTDENGNRPWTSDTNTVATLVLVYTASSYPRLINGDPDSDLTQYWFDMTEERAWTARIFPLPGACGVPVEIKRYQAPGYTVTPTRATGTTSSITIYYDVAFVGDGAQRGRVDFWADMVPVAGQTASTFELLVGTVSGFVTFNATDFGKMAFDPAQDTQVLVHTQCNPPSGGGNDKYVTLTIEY